MERFIRLLRILLVRKIGSRTDKLVREVGGSRSHDMIVYLLSQEMLFLGEDLAPFFLRNIVIKASKRKSGYAEYLNHLGDVRAIAAHTGNDFMSEVLKRSRRFQIDEVVELLTATPPHKQIYKSDELESRHPVQDYVPLGVRKSLARHQHADTLESLLREQDPAVVKNLLGNPRTVEEMVVKMASLRPTCEEVLDEIYINQKWVSRYRVRKALVFNPYASPRIAHSMLPTLLMGDLIEVSLSRTLHPGLLAAAKRFIMHRVSEMSPKEKEQFSERHSALLKRIFLQVG